MNLNDFLTPVELDQPPAYYQPDEHSISRTITIHTPNESLPKPDDFDLAIIGIPEDRNSFNKGSAKAPNKIREKLYQLRGFPGLKIIDLGNLKRGNNVPDTYFGLIEVFSILHNLNLPVIVLGGTQDLTISCCAAYKRKEEHYKLMILDRKVDYDENAKDINSDNYLSEILNPQKNIAPLDIVCAGFQSYFVNTSILDALRIKGCELNRLGIVRSNLHLTEPVLRDTNILSIDISSIKHADAPGYFTSSPNGFYGEELCQVSRYAGISENVSTFGIFEVNPEFDDQSQTSHLSAQMCWYFIDGLSQRAGENPEKDETSFKKFIVAIDKLEQQIVFYKSTKTNRWWVQVPSDINKFKRKNMILSCSADEYEVACQNEIPDRWLEAFHKYN